MKYTAILALLLAIDTSQAIHLVHRAEPAADAKGGEEKAPAPVPLYQENILPAAAIARTKEATESQAASQESIANLVKDTVKLVQTIDK